VARDCQEAARRGAEEGQQHREDAEGLESIMGKKSYHAKDGKFTSFDRANVVHQNGERFKVVRTLEPVKAQGDGDKTNDAPAAAENVAQVKAKVNAMAGRIAPQWIALDEVVEASAKYAGTKLRDALPKGAKLTGKVGPNETYKHGEWLYLVDPKTKEVLNVTKDRR
jgi:hypothetical protein